MLAKIAFKGDVREMVTTLNGLRAVDARPWAIANIVGRDVLAVSARLAAAWRFWLRRRETAAAPNSRITIFPAPRSGDLTAMRLIYNGATGELIRERPIIGMKPSAWERRCSVSSARFTSAISPDGGRAPCGSPLARPAPMWPGAG